jgi:hypothetical protein
MVSFRKDTSCDLLTTDAKLANPLKSRKLDIDKENAVKEIPFMESTQGQDRHDY